MVNQGGFIKTIFLIIIFILILSYFGVSVRSIVENQMVRDNFVYVWTWIKGVWITYLADTASYIWNDIFADLLWDSFLENLKRIKSGENMELMEQAPSVNFNQ